METSAHYRLRPIGELWVPPAQFNGFRVLTALLPGKLCGVEQRAPPIFGRAAITWALAHILVFFISGVALS